MNGSYLKIILLYCLHKIEGQRSIYSVLHLLKGKKSAQTIQDAHFFHLTNLFSSYPYVNRAELENLACEMKEQGLIKQISDQSFQLSTSGIKLLNDSLKKQPISSSLNGWKFHQITDLFWERLSLAIQVISHLKNRDAKYIPIQRKKEVHLWLKNFLHQTSLSRNELGRILNNEIVQCFEKNQELDPSILVMRLTGYKKIGLTSFQTSEMMNMDFVFYYLQFVSLIHYMLESIQESPKDYPLLSMFITNEIELLPLTQSAKKTYSLLKKGLNIEEISQIRKLKKSTIEDHIVEISLNIKSFDISPFVCFEKQQLIKEAVKTNASKQLRYIRQLVPNADYFEIRLSLSRVGEENEA